MRSDDSHCKSAISEESPWRLDHLLSSGVMVVVVMRMMMRISFCRVVMCFLGFDGFFLVLMGTRGMMVVRMVTMMMVTMMMVLTMMVVFTM